MRPIQTGSLYLGTIFLAPVTDLGAFLNEVYFQSFRSNATGARVVASETLPKAAQAIRTSLYASAPGTQVRAIKWTVKYDMGRTLYEESFFCAGAVLGLGHVGQTELVEGILLDAAHGAGIVYEQDFHGMSPVGCAAGLLSPDS